MKNENSAQKSIIKKKIRKKKPLRQKQSKIGQSLKAAYEISSTKTKTVNDRFNQEADVKEFVDHSEIQTIDSFKSKASYVYILLVL